MSVRSTPLPPEWLVPWCGSWFGLIMVGKLSSPVVRLGRGLHLLRGLSYSPLVGGLSLLRAVFGIIMVGGDVSELGRGNDRRQGGRLWGAGRRFENRDQCKHRAERARRGSAEGGCVALLLASTCAARRRAQPLEYVGKCTRKMYQKRP